MSDKPPPKRTSSELTLVIDVQKALSEKARAALANAAESYPNLPTADIDDELLTSLPPDERAALLSAHRAKQDDTPTMVRCPCCRCSAAYVTGCLFCRGDGMVTSEKAATWKAGAP